MWIKGCVGIERFDKTYFSTIYNNEFPPSSPYAAIVINTKSAKTNELLTTYIVNMLNGIADYNG